MFYYYLFFLSKLSRHLLYYYFSALNNPALIEGFLPRGCFTFQPQDVLSQIEQTHCVVSFLRLCSDGSLVDFVHGVCPTPQPTSEPTAPTPQVARVTQSPAHIPDSQAQQQTSSNYGALQSQRNFNVVVGVVAALIFCCLLLLCFYTYRRQRRLVKALADLTSIYDEQNHVSYSVEPSVVSEQSQSKSTTQVSYTASLERSRSESALASSVEQPAFRYRLKLLLLNKFK